MTLKLNIGQKNGKTTQKELSEEHSKALMGKKIGDKIKGDNIGFSGYEFTITGGSDNSGFPMRHDVQGTSRKRILVTKGVGFQGKRKGLRKRRNVAGNTIHDGTVQVNVKVEKEGKAPLDGEADSGEASEEKEESTEKPKESEEKKEKGSEKEDSKDKEDSDEKEESKDDSDEAEGSEGDDSADEGSSEEKKESSEDSKDKKKSDE